MIVPVLLVAGALGAGKTTLLNHLLAHPDGRRIAAVVNDFGAVDIDAQLLGTVTEEVISLKNGCICCSLQGDLLRTLSSVIKRDPAPDAIAIETSGISDPAEIIRNLMDPVIFKVAPLETVVTLVDPQRLRDDPEIAQDALWRSQLRAADFVLLTKSDLLDRATLDQVRAVVGRFKPQSAIFEIANGIVAPDLLFSRDMPVARTPPRQIPVTSEPFATVTWTSQAPLSLPRFQQVIGQLAPRTLRIKGILSFTEHPGQPILFQSVATRGTLAPSPVPLAEGLTAQLVLIGREGELDAAEVDKLLRGIEAA
ncbi:cobalamin synthesis protein CobW [Bradyrhizobium oligotrophicum S58]|uniref:Cobalamin synthesis protein CobW n=1 Tax=Bradyrhizobium oligotrophicum S58 TaxID=1245469 RepID=M4ZMS7_9BRAD|nr:GTP-binding protein [Bradyrhizobium oligotrophicum]BAM87530.1 cobalamin synthesis protein CobW [Bradyrhizobium oligotrophicum S58]